jgi:hypothetical protein
VTAGQAAALRAAAAFPENAGLAGLEVAAAGTIAGHPARVTTHIDEKERHA